MLFTLWALGAVGVLYTGAAARAGQWSAALVGAALFGLLFTCRWLFDRSYGIGTDAEHVYLRNQGPFPGPARRVRFDQLVGVDVAVGGEVLHLFSDVEELPEILVIRGSFEREALAGFLARLERRRPDLFDAGLEGELTPFRV